MYQGNRRKPQQNQGFRVLFSKDRKVEKRASKEYLFSLKKVGRFF